MTVLVSRVGGRGARGDREAVHEAGLIIVRSAGSPVVDEVVHGDRLTGDAATIAPSRAGLWRLVGGE